MSSLFVKIAQSVLVPLFTQAVSLLVKIYRRSKANKKLEDENKKKGDDYMNGSDKEFEKLP